MNYPSPSTRFWLSSLLIIMLAFTNCNKDNDTDAENGNDLTAGTGTFVADLDGSRWNGYAFHATYYTKYHQLYIIATDRKKSLDIRLYAYLDSIAPLKTYRIQGNGTHAAEIDNACNGAYFTALNDNNVNGNIELLKLDTVQLKASGKFQFQAFSPKLRKYIQVSNGTFTDILVDTSYWPNDGSYVSCTINGTDWQSLNMEAKIYGGTSTGRAISIWAHNGWAYENIYALCPDVVRDERVYLNFKLLLRHINPIGTYDLKPEIQPYISEWDTYDMSLFESYEKNSPYSPVDGEVQFQVYNFEKKKLEASFNMKVKNADNKILNITNGKLVLNNWQDFN